VVRTVLRELLYSVTLLTFTIDFRDVTTPYCMLLQLQADNRARQLYKNISMLFLFPVKDGKLSTTGVNATFDASCYG